MTADLRQRIAAALSAEDVKWGYHCGFSVNLADDDCTAAFADAVLAEVQPELDQLRAELADADHHVSPRHWDTFAEHASIESIDVYLRAATGRKDRHIRYVNRLQALRAERAATTSAPATSPETPMTSLPVLRNATHRGYLEQFAASTIHVYRDPAKPGAGVSRPALDRLLRDGLVQLGEYQPLKGRPVVVTDLGHQVLAAAADNPT